MTIPHLRLALLFVSMGLLSAFVASASVENVVYPVAELGNCESQEACFNYCGEPANYDACMAYAQAYELLEEEEIEQYQEMQALVETGGPGGCTSQASCDAYCADLNHMSECLSFARDNGLMDDEQLEEATKVLTALEAGYTPPGGCTDQVSCDAYCGDVSHAEECLSFAQAAGFMSDEEAEQARTMMTIMQSGEMPGGCQGKDACDAYCEDEANLEECTAFALENGLITQEELDRMVPQGDFTGPGGCTSPEECRIYCEQEANFEECSSFFGGEMEGEPREREFDESFDREEFQEPQEFNEMEEFKQDLELRQDFEDREFDPGEFEVQEGMELYELSEPEYRESFDEGAQRVYEEMAPDFKPDEIEGSKSSDFKDFMEPGEYQVPYEQVPYQYEGGQEDTQLYYDEGDIQDGFGGFDPGEYELDLGGGAQGDSGPQEEGGGESDAGGTDSQGAEPQSLAPNDADASFVRSVKRFFSRVTSQAKEFLML